MFSRLLTEDQDHLNLRGPSIFCYVSNSWILDGNSITIKKIPDLNLEQLFNASMDFVPEISVRVWRV